MPRENRGPHLWRAANGVWYVRSFAAGRRIVRSTGERDRARATAVLARTLTELDRPTLAQPTVAAVLDAYAAARAATHGHRQMLTKLRALTRHLGHLNPGEVTQTTVRSYIAARRRESIANSTMRTELGHLRAALRWAAAEDLAPAPRPWTVPLRAKPRDRWLTREECDRLVAAADQPHMRTWLLLMLHTGARPSAVLELPWSAVDLERRVVAYPSKEGGKRRTSVPINDVLLAELQEARERATTPWVVEWAGRRIRQNERAWNRTLARSGIAHCTRHDLRRTAGSLMLQAGVPIELVSAVLGHSSITITRQVYAHLAIEHLRGAVAALG